MNDRPVFIGGIGVVVEVDETVLSRRGVISNPTSLSDDQRDTIWIVGCIDNTPQKNFFLKRVQNRTTLCLTDTLIDNILVGSTVHSDGYRSYPGVCQNIGVQHRVVNHSVGFVAEDGTHTNNIEGFWAHLKSSIRKENGIGRENIDTWLSEYIFKRRYLMNITANEFTVIFIDLLSIFLNKNSSLLYIFCQKKLKGDPLW